MKNFVLSLRFPPRKSLVILFVYLLTLNTFYAQEIDSKIIEQELSRVEVDPDESIEISINAPLRYVFDFLSKRLNEYVEGASAVEFNHSDSEVKGELNIGSIRKLKMENNDFLVQRFLQFKPPYRYAYFTDMEKSTLEAPLNYSLALYEFTESSKEETLVRISVVYESSSRLLAFFVRRAFNSSLRKDFNRAAKTIELNYRNNAQ